MKSLKQFSNVRAVQIGDVDSATALAHTIAAIDPNNTLAQQLMSITAAPSAAHL